MQSSDSEREGNASDTRLRKTIWFQKLSGVKPKLIPYVLVPPSPYPKTSQKKRTHSVFVKQENLFCFGDMKDSLIKDVQDEYMSCHTSI